MRNFDFYPIHGQCQKILLMMFAFTMVVNDFLFAQTDDNYTMIVNLHGGGRFYIGTDSVSSVDFSKGTSSPGAMSLYELAEMSSGLINLGSMAETSGVTKLRGGDYTFTIPRTSLFNKNMIIASRSTYSRVAGSLESDSVPTIQIAAKGSEESQKDSTVAYPIGCLGRYEFQQWRLPALPACMTSIEVHISVPSDKVLELEEFYNYYSDITEQGYDGGIRVNAHGSPITGKFNTYEGFTGAARAGYPCCVVVPKRTKDGMWVCFHDDDNINGVRYDKNKPVCKSKINSEGDTIYTQYDANGDVIGHSPMPVRSLTWNFLKDKIVYSSAYYNIWGDQHIPTLSEFFSVCSKTGMIPMLSVHPAYTEEEWIEIADLAKKHGVLDKLSIKLRPYDAYVNSSIKVLGGQVREYVFYVANKDGLQYALDRMKSTISKVGNVRLTIEMLDSFVKREYVEDIIRAGYVCSVFDSSRNFTGKRINELMSWGVTEFTSNYNHSYGLNW